MHIYWCTRANPFSFAWTTPRKAEISYKWIIDEAEVLLLNAKKTAQSPPLDISKVSPFALYLYASYDSSNKRLRLYFGHDNLNYGDEKPTVWLSKCYASLFDPQTMKVKHGINMSDKEIIKSSGVSNAEQYFNSLKETDLQELLHNGALVIHFHATLTSLSNYDTSTGGKSFAGVDADGKLGHTMRPMLGVSLFSDASIKVGAKMFPIHRVVLASQSNVFKRMFESNMKEKKEGVVEVFDVDSDVMSDLLSYIYCGYAPNIKEMAKDLLFAADKYNLTSLSVLCEKELQTTLTTDNVADVLLVANKLPLRVVLKDACINFIKHNSKDVYQSNSWKFLKETEMALAFEVMEKTLVN